MMKFIGTKVIFGRPMTRAQYNKYRGWTLPENENGDDDGYLVEYLDGGQANHPDHAGYISWSPAEVFARAYRPTAGLTFGNAIEAMKAGQRVARSGWNGKGMWLALGAGNPANPAANFWNPHTRAFAEQSGGTAPVLPYIIMKTATGEILMGWLASQSDMLAEDWIILE